jgi:hypothetical protein
MANLPEGQKGKRYCIKVKGMLSGRWASWFDGLSIQQVGDDETWLVGPIADQAALHGMLAKIRDLGLVLVSVQMVDDMA